MERPGRSQPYQGAGVCCDELFRHAVIASVSSCTLQAVPLTTGMPIRDKWLTKSPIARPANRAARPRDRPWSRYSAVASARRIPSFNAEVILPIPRKYSKQVSQSVRIQPRIEFVHLPEGMLMDGITAIGSIGTAVAAVIALVTLIVAVRDNTSTTTAANATEIRRQLRSFSQETALLTRQLREGSALIVGSANIAKELRERLGPAATVDDFWEYFPNDGSMSGAKTSLAVVGWARTELSRDLGTVIDSHRRMSSSFTGHLSILSETGDLIDGIVGDSYSPMIFIRMLKIENSVFFGEIRNEAKGRSLEFLLEGFTGKLSSNASAYYLERYEVASGLINSFIREIVNFAVGLPDKTLVYLSQSSVSVTMDTRTNQMRFLLKEMKEMLADEKYEELSSMINEIETQISKQRFQNDQEDDHS